MQRKYDPIWWVMSRKWHRGVIVTLEGTRRAASETQESCLRRPIYKNSVLYWLSERQLADIQVDTVSIVVSGRAYSDVRKLSYAHRIIFISKRKCIIACELIYNLKWNYHLLKGQVFSYGAKYEVGEWRYYCWEINVPALPFEHSGTLRIFIILPQRWTWAVLAGMGTCSPCPGLAPQLPLSVFPMHSSALDVRLTYAPMPGFLLPPLASPAEKLWHCPWHWSKELLHIKQSTVDLEHFWLQVRYSVNLHLQIGLPRNIQTTCPQTSFVGNWFIRAALISGGNVNRHSDRFHYYTKTNCTALFPQRLCSFAFTHVFVSNSVW